MTWLYCWPFITLCTYFNPVLPKIVCIVQRWASATPQYCRQPNRLRSCGLKKVVELRLWTFEIWLPQFRNSLQSRANSATFWYLFLSSGWFLKSTKNIFRTVCFLETNNLPLRDSCTRFLPPIFFHESTGFHGKKSRKIAEMKLSSCGLKVADIRKNCDRGIAELWLRSNISLKSCGIAIVLMLYLTWIFFFIRLSLSHCSVSLFSYSEFIVWRRGRGYNMQYKTVFYFRHEQLYTVHMEDSLQLVGEYWTGTAHIILGRPVLKLHFILAPTAGVSSTVNFWFSLFIRPPVY